MFASFSQLTSGILGGREAPGGFCVPHRAQYYVWWVIRHCLGDCLLIVTIVPSFCDCYNSEYILVP